MTHDRRQFLRTLMASASWTMLGGCATLKSCQQIIANRPVRRNLASLSADHPIIVAYRSAITQMKELPSTDRRSWTNQARIHNDFCPHGNWLFLPWHRAYLFYFERICRKLSGMQDFALPYWNWSTTPRVPAMFWGNSTNPLFDSTRQITSSTEASASSVGPGVLTSILDDPNFLMFASASISASDGQRTRAGSGRLEGTPHNYIHPFVGGNMGGFMSPLDPIFWMHHNMVERCWVDWNFERNHANTNDNAWLNRQFTEFCDENGNPVTTKVATGLLYPVFSYRYDDVGPGAESSDRVASREAVSGDQKAIDDRNSRIARSGAAVRLDIVGRFQAQQPLRVALGQPASLRIAVDRDAFTRAQRGDGSRTLLRFESAAADHSEDFSVRVFLNKPDASADTPPEDPHFVGSFAFFHHGGAGREHGGSSKFVLDASAAVRRINLDGGAIEVTTVLVPYPNRQPQVRELRMNAPELQLVKDIVQRAKE
jgi:tyrosinase